MTSELSSHGHTKQEVLTPMGLQSDAMSATFGKNVWRAVQITSNKILRNSFNSIYCLKFCLK
jgi:hypothetical protein